MTPEVAEYHRAMLLVGLRDRFDKDFDQALENEDPLSDLILDLSTCASDLNQTISVLHHYTLDHPVDEQKVCELVLEDIRSRYRDGSLSKAQVVTTLYSIVSHLGKLLEEPWDAFTYLSDKLELLEDQLISEEVFDRCFDAWLFHGEYLDAWKLQCELEQRVEKPCLTKAYWVNLSVTVLLIVLSIIAIAATVYLTGNRDMPDFTEQDWRIWGIFFLSEIAIWGLAFFFAARCGRLWRHRDAAELTILEKYKNIGLSCYPQYEKVFFEHKCPRRAVAFRNDATYAVTIEHFDFEHLCWHPIEHEEDLTSMDAVVDFLLNEQDFSFDDPQ